MPKTINFLSHQRKKVTRTQLQDKKYFLIGSIFFAVSLVLTVSVVAVRSYFHTQLTATTTAIEVARSEIAQNSSNIDAITVFVLKLKKLVELESTKKNKTAQIESIQAIFGPVALIDEMTVMPVQSQMKFGLKTKDVFKLAEVIRLANDPETKKKLTSVALSGLVRGADGSYILQVIVPL